MGTQGKRERALIFGSVRESDWSFLKPRLTEPFWVVCADGGVVNARSAGLEPDVVIGDWDSGGAPVPGANNISLSPEKDMTDLQAAMEQALSLGARELLLCGCTGGPRLDHTASNLVILEWLSARGGRGLLLDRQNEVRLLDSETLVVPNVPPRYRYFSLIPLDRTVTGVTLEGARYPLHRAVLTRGDTLSVSNEPAGSATRITIGSGRVLLIRSQPQL